MVLLLYRQSSLVVQILYTGSLESYHLFRSIDTFSPSRKTKTKQKSYFWGGLFFLSTRNFCVCVCVAQGKEWNTHTHTRADKKKREIGTSPKTPDRIKRLFKHALDILVMLVRLLNVRSESISYFFLFQKEEKEKNPALIVPRCSFLRVFDTYREVPAQLRRVAHKRRGTQNSFVDVIIVNDQIFKCGRRKRLTKGWSIDFFGVPETLRNSVPPPPLTREHEKKKKKK